MTFKTQSVSQFAVVERYGVLSLNWVDMIGYHVLSFGSPNIPPDITTTFLRLIHQKVIGKHSSCLLQYPTVVKWRSFKDNLSPSPYTKFGVNTLLRYDLTSCLVA